MLKVGLVGCGRISKKHSEILGNCGVTGITLGAVCDKNIKKAKALSENTMLIIILYA